MAESAIFFLFAGLIIIGVYSVVDLPIDPRILLWTVVILVVPGIYAAITGGPYVPSARKRHKVMMNLAEISDQDIVYDLGCGDGRLVFSASKLAKKAIGYELSVPLFLFGKLRSFFYPKATIRYGNFWNKSYDDASVIFCYLLPKTMKRFHKDIWPKLKPGTRVVVNAFPMRDLKSVKAEKKVYLYHK
jgi:SAM-dependent methyltransferase